jgi:hypothetical protein
MSAAPRIRRVAPNPDELYRTNTPVPVIASLRWSTGGSGWGQLRDVEALALAWTLNAVEIAWTDNGKAQIDWIDAQDIRRP